MIIENSHPEFVNSRVEVAHLFPSGEVVLHEHVGAAAFGACLFGGMVVRRTVFETAWVPAPKECQPARLMPE